MNRTFVLLLLSLVILSSCKQPEMRTIIQDPYYTQINSLRKAKDLEFKGSDSPLEPEMIAGFKGLKYYPIDTAYRVKASLIQFEVMDTFEMPTTTERKPKYLRFGMVNFVLKDHAYFLEVYKNVEYMNKAGHENDLFIPFRDETSAKESYGGGRYLDIKASGPQYLTLDFNLAYNPYCAYNHKYSCPIPPDVNYLKTEVRAGEMTFDY
jgi:uncharacterized protein